MLAGGGTETELLKLPGLEDDGFVMVGIVDSSMSLRETEWSGLVEGSLSIESSLSGYFLFLSERDRPEFIVNVLFS